jgi:DNA-binding MarR family transcriptional regulator
MEKMIEPTERQRELLAYMAGYHDSHGRWPSQREIAQALGVNSTNMSGYLWQLVSKRLVRKTRQRSRNAVVTQAGRIAIAVTEQERQM